MGMGDLRITNNKAGCISIKLYLKKKSISMLGLLAYVINTTVRGQKQKYHIELDASVIYPKSSRTDKGT
jgi:hypothetical protein